MPAGTLMAFCSDQGMVGSLSGGCIEEDLLEKMENSSLVAADGRKTFPLELIYGNTEQQQQQFLLPCGGQLHLLIESLQPTTSTIHHFSEIKKALLNRQRVGREIKLSNGDMKFNTSIVKCGVKHLDGLIEHGMGSQYQMLLIGASEVARAVAELALSLDFAVSVWDHREEFIRNWQVTHVEIFTGSPEKLIQQKFNDANNAIIALAHDPRVDDMALVDALSTNAFYVGAIGSMQTCVKRNQRLEKYLVDQSQLLKLHAPVGISIGSKTPNEIAISILAEVIQERSLLEKSR